MSERLVGEIETYPWLTLTVEAQGGKQDVRFLVDTGFDGEFAIPHSLRSLFGTSLNTYNLRFANGDEEDSMIVQCRIEWVDGPREVTAVYIKGENPLLGMELMASCLVTLEIENDQGQFTIEAI